MLVPVRYWIVLFWLEWVELTSRASLNLVVLVLQTIRRPGPFADYVFIGYGRPSVRDIYRMPMLKVPSAKADMCV